MSHIRVRPDALSSAGDALVRIGDALAEIASELASASGAGDAANQPDVAAAFDRALSVWKQELQSLSHAVTAAGRVTRNAGETYVAVDENVVPGFSSR